MLYIKKHNNKYYILYDKYYIGPPIDTKEDAILIAKWFNKVLPLFVTEVPITQKNIKNKIIEQLYCVIDNLQYHNSYNTTFDMHIQQLIFFINSIIQYINQESVTIYKKE